MAQNRETHTCIICGYEWEEVVEGGGWTTQGKLTTLSSFLRKQEGKKWDVYLHDEAWLCNHCYNLYAEKWKDKLKVEFDCLLQSAKEEQSKYAERVAQNKIIEKQKELLKKLEELKKQINEIK